MAPQFIGEIDINKGLVFLFGVVFIVVMLVFATAYDNPTPFQVWVFITVLALAAAGVGAMIPGFFEIRHKHIVRAGGAVGFFLVVFFNQPILVSNVVKFTPPNTPPDPVAKEYLSEVDGGDLSKAWNSLDEVARTELYPDFAKVQQIYDSYRKPLGAVISRELVGTNAATSPSGAPVGLYNALVYRTKFAGTTGCRPEVVTVRANQDLRWRVFSHQIGPSSIDC
jgi:uncharacterized protein DUF4019